MFLYGNGNLPICFLSVQPNESSCTTCRNDNEQGSEMEMAIDPIYIRAIRTWNTFVFLSHYQQWLIIFWVMMNANSSISCRSMHVPCIIPTVSRSFPLPLHFFEPISLATLGHRLFVRSLVLSFIHSFILFIYPLVVAIGEIELYGNQCYAKIQVIQAPNYWTLSL